MEVSTEVKSFTKQTSNIVKEAVSAEVKKVNE